MELGRRVALGLGALLIGVFLGQSCAPGTIDFPDPNEARSAQEMEQRVREALSEPRAFPRAGALLRLFEGLSTENVAGVTRAFDAHTGPGDPVDLQLLLSAWVLLDPLSAVTAVQGWPDRARREIGMKIAVREWAATGDRLAATSFVETIADPVLRQVMWGPLVRGWALSGGREPALVFARRLWDQKSQVDVVDGYVRGVMQTDGLVAALEMARQGDPHAGNAFDQRLARVTLNLVGEKDPALAAGYFEELAGEGELPEWMGGVLDRLAWRWRSIHDPAAAMVWLRSLPDTPQRRKVLTTTAAEWAQQDLDGAWAWFGENVDTGGSGLLAVPDSAVLAGLVRRTVRTRPQDVTGWVQRLREEDDREVLQRAVAYYLAMQEMAIAETWIDGLGLPRPAAERLREAARRGAQARAKGEAKGEAPEPTPAP